VENVFEGEKTWVFWIGLIIFASACVGVFSVVWGLAAFPEAYNREYFVRFLPPPIVGSVVFIIIGFYMMKSGVKKQIKT